MTGDLHPHGQNSPDIPMSLCTNLFHTPIPLPKGHRMAGSETNVDLGELFGVRRRHWLYDRLRFRTLPGSLFDFDCKLKRPLVTFESNFYFPTGPHCESLGIPLPWIYNVSILIQAYQDALLYRHPVAARFT